MSLTRAQMRPRRTLADLPPPPPGRSGWPWTEAPPPPTGASAGATGEWPLVSIVTPSYQQAAYLEETLRSVLLQGYPRLEYVVMDGGSTDGSAALLQRYAPWLHHWQSARDGGQTAAINAGFRHTQGDLRAYLNSDDTYRPGALWAVAEAARRAPARALLAGGCLVTDAVGQPQAERRAQIASLAEALDLWQFWWQGRNFVQPEVFWTKAVAEAVGDFREDLHFVMDWDYWCRALQAGATVVMLPGVVATFRLQPQQKSAQAERVADEHRQVLAGYLDRRDWRLPGALRWRLRGLWAMDAIVRPRLAATPPAARWQRWQIAATLALRYPALLSTVGFWQRLGASLGGRKGGPR